jgi:hypothetical protein
VLPGEHWKPMESAIQELTDMEQVHECNVECQFEQIISLDNRPHARVSFAGKIRGINEDGPNLQQLEGYLYFDLESHHLSYLSLKGTSSLLDKEGRTVGQIQGRFTMTRKPDQQLRELDDVALKGVALEPNAENTRLLYENVEQGLRFLYSRRWHVAASRVDGLDLDEPSGGGLRMTLEPAERVPTAQQFMAESRAFLQGQQLRIVHVDEPRLLQTSPNRLERFAFQTDSGSQQASLEYYVARQQQGGVTLVARLLPREKDIVRNEVEQIARSITVLQKRQAGNR